MTRTGQVKWTRDVMRWWCGGMGKRVAERETSRQSYDPRRDAPVSTGAHIPAGDGALKSERHATG